MALIKEPVSFTYTFATKRTAMRHLAIAKPKSKNTRFVSKRSHYGVGTV